MKFLVAKQPTRANIFGHDYEISPFHSPSAGLKDILVSEDYSAYELLKRHRDILATISFEKDKIPAFPKPLDGPDNVPAGSKILILRSGGIGDHLMFIPALKAFKECLGDRSVEVRLSVQKDMFPIFRGTPYVDRLYPLPIHLHDVLEADYLVDFSETESKSLGPDLHLTDFFLRKLGIHPEAITDRIGRVSEDLRKSAETIALFNQLREAHPGRSIILLNWHASTVIKSLPPFLFTRLTRKFPETLFLVAHPCSLDNKTQEAREKYDLRITNISFQMKTLYDLFTAISLSDAVVCADTSLYHIASIYQKPSLVIMGPTYPILTAYYPFCSYIETGYRGRHCSAPCGRTRGICPELVERRTPYSPCLMSISEDLIAYRFQGMLKERLTFPY